MNSLLSSAIEDIRNFLSTKTETLVVTHFFPDGDAIGSLIAFGGLLEQFGVPYTLAIDDKCPAKYSFLKGIESIRNLKIDPLEYKFSRVTILDAGAMSRIGTAGQAINEDAVILNIDHHFTGDIYGHINLVNTNAAATSEILFDLTMALGAKITPPMANALFTGILTDTGRFRFANTTSHSMQVAAKLLEVGADPGVITESVYYNMPLAQAHALSRALSALETSNNGRFCMIGLDSRDGVDDTEGFVEYAASVKGVEVAAFYCEIDDGVYKVSLRSRCDVDVSAVAAGFGGGGHKKASGFRFRGQLSSLKLKLVKTIDSFLSSVSPTIE